MTIEIAGRVIKGEGFGKVLGFPTANLDRRGYARRKLKINLGIWAGVADFYLHAKRYTLNAAVVIGPIDKRGLPKLEAHLIGFSGDLYGQKISLKLLKYIRKFRRFASEEDLKKQIRKDLIKIRIA